MKSRGELDGIIAELERVTLELARSVAHRDPSFADHIHARAEALRALQQCRFDQALPGQLTRLSAVMRLGGSVEHSIRQWRGAVMAELASLSRQTEMARAAREVEPAGSILDMTI